MERAETLVEEIATWWPGDRAEAGSRQCDSDPSKTLLYLPRPYVTAGGSTGSFPHMYGWDTNFINMALLIQGYPDFVADHIENQLYMIGKWGYVLNGNSIPLSTRSQTPLLHESVRWYLEWSLKEVGMNKEATRDLLSRAYRLLKREYLFYWKADHHRNLLGTPCYHDLGDKNLRRELADEAESGLDFTPLFDGNAGDTVSVLLLSSLGRFAENMRFFAVFSEMPKEDIAFWEGQRKELTEQLNRYCWNEDKGFFFSWSCNQEKQIPVWDITAFWALWAGMAEKQQAARLVEQIHRFLQPGGVSQSDRVYPSPHREFSALQWQYPAGWAPMQIITIQGLNRYGYKELAEEISRRFLFTMIHCRGKEGGLYEKYNVVDISPVLPVERYGNLPLHGWSAAAAVLLQNYLNINMETSR